MSLEVERAFVTDQAPERSALGVGRQLRQGYVAREGEVEVRVRSNDDGDARLTVKAGRGLVRTEVELPLTSEQADALWALTEGRRLAKTRYRVPVGGHTAEVDIYSGDLAGLCRIEVEFDSAAAADAFEPPTWFGVEVTDDVRWSNSSLARQGRPDHGG